MKQRNNLKGSGVVFGDDLCPKLRYLQKEIKNFPLVKDSWAWNGKLFAEDKNGKFITSNIAATGKTNYLLEIKKV